VSRFLLRPITSGLPDPVWSLSWHSGPCEISAKSVEEARQIAAGQFTVAMLSDPAMRDQRSPWYESHLVVVEVVRAELADHCRLTV
jgi:hypothetical protein